MIRTCMHRIIISYFYWQKMHKHHQNHTTTHHQQEYSSPIQSSSPRVSCFTYQLEDYNSLDKFYQEHTQLAQLNETATQFNSNSTYKHNPADNNNASLQRSNPCRNHQQTKSISAKLKTSTNYPSTANKEQPYDISSEYNFISESIIKKPSQSSSSNTKQVQQQRQHRQGMWVQQRQGEQRSNKGRQDMASVGVLDSKYGISAHPALNQSPNIFTPKTQRREQCKSSYFSESFMQYEKCNQSREMESKSSRRNLSSLKRQEIMSRYQTPQASNTHHKRELEQYLSLMEAEIKPVLQEQNIETFVSEWLANWTISDSPAPKTECKSRKKKNESAKNDQYQVENQYSHNQYDQEQFNNKREYELKQEDQNYASCKEEQGSRKKSGQLSNFHHELKQKLCDQESEDNNMMHRGGQASQLQAIYVPQIHIPSYEGGIFYHDDSSQIYGKREDDEGLFVFDSLLFR